MRLSDFISAVKGVEKAGRGDPAILGLAADSRDVRPGFIFAVIPGNKADGAKFIDDAVENGAAAFLSGNILAHDRGLPYVVADDVRKTLGEFADLFYQHPAQSLDLVGVTGTNGKTTTAFLLRHLFDVAGRKTGMLGTIEYDLGDRVEVAPLTTPDAVRFTRSLAEMRDYGCKAAVAEVSSHALAQHRVWPHRFAAAIFTNLTRDHLDYHGDMDSYLEAKRSLFLRLGEKAIAVFNFRDPAAVRMAEGTKAKVFGYVLDDDGAEKKDAGPLAAGVPDHVMRASIVESSLDGQTFRVKGYGFEREFHTPLVGRYNVENCLGVILCAHGMGEHPETIARGIARFPGVPGRLERIESRSGVKAFVDYSHTDDSLRSALSVLRPLVKGKLIAVFGCGGDRDPGKRPLMAKAAEEFSDLVVVTSDNPRTEDPDAIIDAAMKGFSRPENVVREKDRPTAVRIAVSRAKPGDAILVAGKGHEDYQIVGTEKMHMDDRELVRDAFAATGRAGQ